MKTAKQVLICILFLMTFCLAGCNQSSESAIDENKLEYGATIDQLKRPTFDVPIPVEYDRRFVTQDEGFLLSYNYEAINTNDAELFKSTCYGDYVAFLTERSKLTPEEYLKAQYDGIKETYLENEDFKFNMILVENCFSPYSDIEKLREHNISFKTLDERLAYYGDQHSEPNILSKVTDRKAVLLNLLYEKNSEPGSAFSMERRTGSLAVKYLYTIDGKPYLF